MGLGVEKEVLCLKKWLIDCVKSLKINKIYLKKLVYKLNFF